MNDIPENYVPTFFEIEIPEEFIVKECLICETWHAAIRECPKEDESEENDSQDLQGL